MKIYVTVDGIIVRTEKSRIIFKIIIKDIEKKKKPLLLKRTVRYDNELRLYKS